MIANERASLKTTKSKFLAHSIVLSKSYESNIEKDSHRVYETGNFFFHNFGQLVFGHFLRHNSMESFE